MAGMPSYGFPQLYGDAIRHDDGRVEFWRVCHDISPTHEGRSCFIYKTRKEAEADRRQFMRDSKAWGADAKAWIQRVVIDNAAARKPE